MVMKALVLRELGGPEKLAIEEMPMPEPGCRLDTHTYLAGARFRHWHFFNGKLFRPA